MNKDNNKLVEIEWYPEIESRSFDDYSLLELAKRSLPGRLYIKYLKKNKAIKSIVDLLWTVSIPVFLL